MACDNHIYENKSLTLYSSANIIKTWLGSVGFFNCYKNGP